jgi:predicted nucleotidyltransferase
VFESEERSQRRGGKIAETGRMADKSQIGLAGNATQEKFSAALEAFIEQAKRDRSVLAAILCGSLSHDTVWEKSDIDLLLVTVDDKKAGKQALSLYADGINLHAFLMPRTEFRRTVEGSIRNSFTHSLIAKGRLLYTHDESIAGLCAELQAIGERDVQVQLLAAAVGTLPAIYKAHKWFITRKDLDYTALWILYAANGLAKIEVLSSRLLLDRESLPQALKLNPSFFKAIYVDILNSKKTSRSIQAALSAIDDYLANRVETLFGPVIDHLREAGEARSATEIEDYFRRNLGIEGITGACEYLADLGVIGKAPLPVRITHKSNVDVDELAFFYATRTVDAG